MHKQTKKNYFITGGGTGGHIYPAVSITKALQSETNTKNIYYVGNPNNLEAKIAKEEGIPFLPVNITSMPRKLNFDFFKWTLQLFTSTLKSVYYIKKYKPNAVFGTGGYVSAPAIIAALLTRTPYMIHDSDSHPGIVSRSVSFGAKHISVAFEEAKNFIKNKNISVFGNPIKPDFFSVTKEEARKELQINNAPLLLIMGGSQGAMTINNTVVNCIKFFTEELKINIILQTGSKNYDKTLDLLEKIYPEYKNNPQIIIKPYFSNMAIPLKASDLVISRSGSLSLSEIAAVEVPSILIPFPYAAADHQRKNALCYEAAGASVYIDDLQLNNEILENTVKELIFNFEKLNKMSKAVRKFSRPNATLQITQKFKEIAK